MKFLSGEAQIDFNCFARDLQFFRHKFFRRFVNIASGNHFLKGTCRDIRAEICFRWILLDAPSRVKGSYRHTFVHHLQVNKLFECLDWTFEARVGFSAANFVILNCRLQLRKLLSFLDSSKCFTRYLIARNRTALITEHLMQIWIERIAQKGAIAWNFPAVVIE